MNVFTVSDFNENIKNILINNITNDVYVEGEISNCKTYGNHIYFTIKDTLGILNCCAWNWYLYNNTNIQKGDNVQVVGKVSVYNKMGYYQLNVKNIIKIGKGLIYENYEIMKKHYESLGYFNKKRIPNNIISNICIITAKEGAALQDILVTLKNGNYKGLITIKNASVQGKDCAKSISESIKLMDNYNFDIIVITRGGGSYEDLIGFNDPLIIEAIYNAKTIILSAIGHEIDNLLSDMVADIRAATPTMAASIILNYKLSSDIYNTKLKNIKDRIQNRLIYNNNKLNTYKNKLLEYNNHDNIIKKYNDKINKYKNIIFNKLTNYKDTITKINYNFNLIKISSIKLIAENNIYVNSKKDYLYNKANNIKMKLIFDDGEIDL